VKKIYLNKYFFFALLSLTTFLFYGFYNYFYLQPQGFHFTRQTDSLCFIDNYLENNLRFFETGNYNLNSVNGNAACEFPIFYYLFALIIKATSSSYYIVRIINLFFVYFSLIYLFKTIYIFIENRLLASFLTFLFFSSTVLIHYSVSFLPDINSLALSLIANYYAIKSIKTYNSNSFIKAVILYTICVLIKPYYIIYFIAFSIIILIFFRPRLKNFSIIIFSFALIASWILHVKNYNLLNNSFYYLTTFSPIWQLNRTEIREVLDFISNYWYSKYYYQTTLHLFLLVFLISPYFLIKNIKKPFTILLILLIGGIFAYFIVFFRQFKDHDYYFITIIPGITIYITFILKNIYELFENANVKRTIILVILIITFLSINYSQEKLQNRYSKSFISGSMIGYNLQNCDKFLDSIKIGKDKKFLILGDETPNGGLFFIKRKGWTVVDLEGENESYFKDKLIKTDYLIITPQQKRYFNKKSYICYNTDDIIMFRNNLIIKIK